MDVKLMMMMMMMMDVVKLIGQAPNKSCARDPLPTWMVKNLADELEPFITVLFNKSISDGYFPRNFRVAEITPIFKKTSLDSCVITNYRPRSNLSFLSKMLDSCVITNYRPISNLSFLSKMLERVINNQLLVHFGENNALPESQSAYRASHSTETALLKITSDALLAADGGMLTLLGLLDLSAAFDWANSFKRDRA